MNIWKYKIYTDKFAAGARGCFEYSYFNSIAPANIYGWLGVKVRSLSPDEALVPAVL